MADQCSNSFFDGKSVLAISHLYMCLSYDSFATRFLQHMNSSRSLAMNAITILREYDVNPQYL